MTPTSMVYEFSDLIVEHTVYCQEKYQPYRLPHLTTDQALAFQDKMSQSLTHFGMWLDTVKKKELRRVE